MIGPAPACFVGRMASAYHKKDIREEMDLLYKEEGKVESSPTPADKEVEKTLIAPIPTGLTEQHAIMVPDATTPVLVLGSLQF